VSRVRSRTSSVLGAILASILCATPARAAEPADTVRCGGALARAAASVHLPVHHWSLAAVRRADALGLLDEPLALRRTLTRATVARLLCQAERHAAERGDALGALAQGWNERLAEEFGPDAELRAAPRAGYAYGRGLVAPGLGEFPPERTGPLTLADRSALDAGVELSAQAGRHLAASVEPEAFGRELTLAAGEVAVGAGAFSISAGRQAVGYGAAEGGGVVLSGAEAVDAVQLETTRGLRLPRPLGWLGPIDFQTFLSRFNSERHPGAPYFWGASGAIHPHPRLTLAVHRAALFGGERSELPITPRSLWQMLLGEVHGRKNFEDQVVSVEGRFRLPTESVLPLTIYLEWGSEDAAGAWRDVPGRVAGAFVPRIPGAPALSLGVERAAFRASCCFNPPWYRHVGFPGSWAGESQPLGHPLGGEGREWLLYSRAELLDSRLELAGRGYRRKRGAENLFAPERAGRSTGGAMNARWRLARAIDLRVAGEAERGEGWTMTRIEAGMSAYLFR
jgi:hypothetical protein